MGRAADASDTAPRRDVFDVDTGRVLEALRATWGDTYAIGFDDAICANANPWQAWHLDGSGARLAGASPDELNRALHADSARRDTP